jgi:hypothetical protein
MGDTLVVVENDDTPPESEPAEITTFKRTPVRCWDMSHRAQARPPSVDRNLIAARNKMSVAVDVEVLLAGRA